MSLYIDDGYLNKIKFPIFCRLFKQIEKQRKIFSFDENSESETNIKNSLETLVNKLMEYFDEIV